MHCNQADQADKAPVVWWMIVKINYRKAWQIDYITLPQTHHGKLYMLTMTGTTTVDGWRHTLCLTPLPGTQPWALKSNSCSDMVP